MTYSGFILKTVRSVHGQVCNFYRPARYNPVFVATESRTTSNWTESSREDELPETRTSNTVRPRPTSLAERPACSRSNLVGPARLPLDRVFLTSTLVVLTAAEALALPGGPILLLGQFRTDAAGIGAGRHARDCGGANVET